MCIIRASLHKKHHKEKLFLLHRFNKQLNRLLLTLYKNVNTELLWTL